MHEKKTIINAIREQGKLTDALADRIRQCNIASELEDIYLPYKQKRQSKGQKAIAQGLQPLAIYMQNQSQDQDIENKALEFLNGDIDLPQTAISGAVSIIAEAISENQWVRKSLRNQFTKHANSIGKVKKGKEVLGEKYKNYFEFNERVSRMAAHRTLALFRAEKEGIIQFKIDVESSDAIDYISRALSGKYAANGYVEKAIGESYKRILQPNFESEIKKSIKEKADIESIHVFAQNLKQLLLQAPLGAKNILAIDPGFRTGCKVAILNNRGDFISHTTIYPHPPQSKTKESEIALLALIKKHNIEALAIGNGTAGIETEEFCRKICKDLPIDIFSVNEAGASIYSASEIARAEFGTLDLTIRGAISIGRRLMDPLAELVKIDANAIGVGQYQHDVNQTLLNRKLSEIVTHCVNHVGVDLNTASFPILSFVSGLGPTLAKNIVSYRNDNGPFKNRKELLKVSKMGAKTYKQAAGFLRIENGENPLDNTIIHPESYAIVKDVAKSLGVSIEKVIQEKNLHTPILDVLKKQYGAFTVDFVLKELERPTRDPRSPLVYTQTTRVSSIEALYPGQELTGTVNNITHFGAFVNIGMKESGLIHISELSDSYVSDIHQVVKLNQSVDVTVIDVDIERKRIQLRIRK